MRWETFLSFRKILIGYDATKNQKCAFVVRFFSNLEMMDYQQTQFLPLPDFLKVLHMLTHKIDKLMKAKADESLELSLIDTFVEVKVINEEL